jgi:hypothetical protein
MVRTRHNNAQGISMKKTTLRPNTSVKLDAATRETIVSDAVSAVVEQLKNVNSQVSRALLRNFDVSCTRGGTGSEKYDPAVPNESAPKIRSPAERALLFETTKAAAISDAHSGNRPPYSFDDTDAMCVYFQTRAIEETRIERAANPIKSRLSLYRRRIRRLLQCPQ